MKIDMDKYLDRRLDEWATWCLKRNDHGLGYPKVNFIHRMIHEGRVIINSTGLKKEYSHPQAEEIETLVKEMREHDKKMADALCKDWLGPERTNPAKAKALMMSEKQFRIHVNSARAYLIGSLSAQAHRFYY